MTEEARTLKDSASKTRNEQGTEDFATALTYANKGTGATPNEQAFLIAVEQMITGKNQTFDSAAALIAGQSQNVDNVIALLEKHAAKITEQQKRLDWLEAHHGT
jgi:hypothetical protein